MKIIEHDDLNEIIDKINSDQLFLCNINTGIDFTVAKQNGYKIFSVYIEEGDPYYEPDDLHGLRIYTILNNKFKDCKTIAIPFFEMDGLDHKSQFIRHFRPDADSYRVYINNGYANILLYGQDMQCFEGKDPFGKFGMVLISDGMYMRRSNAILKLLEILNCD